jgi:4a-hydroxytetrahydrobiopterin dehydratase
MQQGRFQVDDEKARRCIPCEGGTDPLPAEQAHERLGRLAGWEPDQDARVIRRTFELADFSDAIDFVNAIAAVAEREDHHPDIEVFSYNNVRVQLSTHKIGGLSNNDFIMADEIGRLWGERESD